MESASADPPLERVAVEPYPELAVELFETVFPEPLGNLPSPPHLKELLSLEAEAPLKRSEDIRLRIRNMLRARGYKPTGRGKPASEYLVREASNGALRSINLAVDVCNAVSLHSGLPISLVDRDRLRPPLKIAVPPSGSSYVFNPAGQEIRLDGLLCLHDAEGPCANAVKDSQRTKTSEGTTRTLTVVWASEDLSEHLRATVEWYRSLLAEFGATTRPIPTAPLAPP